MSEAWSIAQKMSRRVSRLRFGAPVAHVYNPLQYAAGAHREYLDRYGEGRREVVLLGMNPGPWGMAQTGVPFGEVAAVRDWMGIGSGVRRPRRQHPKRPILGFDCHRSEVSGARLWGWARDAFGSAEKFFKRFFVANYCPLAFLEKSGRNLTPDKLPAKERQRLFSICDEALYDLISHFDPDYVVGVGAFAKKRAELVLANLDVVVGSILHPSPASPRANRGWAKQAASELQQLGVGKL